MKRWSIIAVLLAAVAATVMNQKSGVPAAKATPAASMGSVNTGMPRILDLGATACVPCKMMAPILEELKAEYAGKLQVDFIDVWKNEAAGVQYGVSSIPTQIFFDATGKELHRHIGFMSKDDILSKCRELGFNLNAQSEPQTGATK